MNLKVYVSGQGFGETSNIQSVVDLLNNYDVILNSCLKQSCVYHDARTDAVTVRLGRVAPGSLDVNLVANIAAGFVPIAPQVLLYAWDLSKAVYDLIAFATDYFAQRGRPVTIHTTDSPGTVNIVNIVAGDQVYATPGAVSLAKTLHSHFDKIAGIVKSNKADRITLSSEDQARQFMEFNRQNQHGFRIDYQEEIEDQPITLECSIYRFNRRSLVGYLEYFDEEGKAQTRPFKIRDEDLLESCIEALRAMKTTVSALREMSVNALGETTIKRFHLINISNSE